jgi:hypothetical protein
MIILFDFAFSFIALSRTDVKQWCKEHEYELLELEKSTTSETDDDDDDPEEEEDNHRKREKKLFKK